MNEKQEKWITIGVASGMGFVFLCCVWCGLCCDHWVRGEFWSWKQCAWKEEVKPEEKTEEVLEEEGGAD